jgi:hypothetical protein
VAGYSVPWVLCLLIEGGLCWATEQGVSAVLAGRRGVCGAACARFAPARRAREQRRFCRENRGGPGWGRAGSLELLLQGEWGTEGLRLAVKSRVKWEHKAPIWMQYFESVCSHREGRLPAFGVE